MAGVLISCLFCLLWLIFTICAVINHFIGNSDSKKFQQDTYMFDNVRGKLVVNVEGEEPLTIPFYKNGKIVIDDNISVLISEEGYGRISISDIFVNGYLMFKYCPKGIAWDSRANYCINMMRTQGLASGQVSEQAIERIEKVQRNVNRVNSLLREGRLTVKHDKDGEPYYFYNV